VKCSSILPESARWMMSKRDYDQAEQVLEHIAKVNQRTFDRSF